MHSHLPILRVTSTKKIPIESIAFMILNMVPVFSSNSSRSISLTSQFRHAIKISLHSSLPPPQYADSIRYRTFFYSSRKLAVKAKSEDGKGEFPQTSLKEKTPLYTRWDVLTSTIAASSTFPFLLLQMPQIILNAQNLMAGNPTALAAVGWLGQLTGLLGNLSLLSYFSKKKETGATVVQTVGVLSQYVIVFQLALARTMPAMPFFASSAAVGVGLILNFLYYYNLLNPSIWTIWEDFITIGGLAVLPQVMWSTFVPYLPQSFLPGLISCALALTAVIMARTGKLSKQAVQIVNSTAGWTATLLFMWMPVAQMWTNYLNPKNIQGLSSSSLLLAMIGNSLLIPRALFTRDMMWFTGASWAALLYGWGNILSVYICGGINSVYFSIVTAALVSWLGVIFWTDAKAYGLRSPFSSFLQLVSGSG